MITQNLKIYAAVLITTTVLIAGCNTLGQQTQKSGAELSYNSAPMARGVYPMPPAGNDVIGSVYTIKAQKGDTFNTIAQRYDMGGEELRNANRHLNPNKIAEGSKIVIPAAFILPPPKYRHGIVVNLPELRLYYFTPENTVMTYPVAIGREGWVTPLGKTIIYRKKEKPVWNVPKSIREAYLAKTGQEHPLTIAPGPKNPLGDYAIYLQMNGYLIHGNNDPASIGRLVSSGCIRMYNEDVKELYQYVKRGTEVSIIYYPNKVGVRDGKIYMESHKPILQQAKEYSENAITLDKAIAEMSQINAPIDNTKVQQVMQQQSGVPRYIG